MPGRHRTLKEALVILRRKGWTLSGGAFDPSWDDVLNMARSAVLTQLTHDDPLYFHCPGGPYALHLKRDDDALGAEPGWSWVTTTQRTDPASGPEEFDVSDSYYDGSGPWRTATGALRHGTRWVTALVRQEADAEQAMADAANGAEADEEAGVYDRPTGPPPTCVHCGERITEVYVPGVGGQWMHAMHAGGHGVRTCNLPPDAVAVVASPEWPVATPRTDPDGWTL